MSAVRKFLVALALLGALLGIGGGVAVAAQQQAAAPAVLEGVTAIYTIDQAVYYTTVNGYVLVEFTPPQGGGELKFVDVMSPHGLTFAVDQLTSTTFRVRVTREVSDTGTVTYKPFYGNFAATFQLSFQTVA